MTETIRNETVRMLSGPRSGLEADASRPSSLRRLLGFVIAFALGVLTGRAAKAH